MEEPPPAELTRLTALHRAGIAVVRQRAVADVMTTVIQELAQTLGYHYVSVYLWDEPTLRLQAQQGYATPAAAIPPHVGVIGRVFRTGESALITDPAADPDFFFVDTGVRSQIAVPIFDGERCCGGVSVESAGVLDVRDHELLELFAQQIGVAITTARLHAALVHAAWTDPLTGVLNRAALLIGIEGALAEAAAHGIGGLTIEQMLGELEEGREGKPPRSIGRFAMIGEEMQEVRVRIDDVERIAHLQIAVAGGKGGAGHAGGFVGYGFGMLRAKRHGEPRVAIFSQVTLQDMRSALAGNRLRHQYRDSGRVPIS